IRLALHGGRAGVGALLVLLAGAAAAADAADHPSADDDGRAAERRQDFTLRDDWHHLPEAPALRAERRQFGRAAPKRGGGSRLGPRGLRREKAGSVAARAQHEAAG